MPYIVTSSWYPTHKNDEAVKIYIEGLKKYPPSKIPGKLIVPVAVTTTKKGLKSMRIREIKTDDGQSLSDALKTIGEMMTLFLGIEGFEYSIRIWDTISEAMRNIKKESPE